MNSAAKQTAKNLNIITLVIVGMTLSSCKQGSVSSSGSSGGGSVSGTLGITKVYPTASGPTWTAITSASRYYIKGLNLSIKGTCSAGTAIIKVDPGTGPYTETAACGIAGDFTWNRTYLGAEEGDITLALQGYDVGGISIAGALANVNVRVDNTPPPAPVVVDPAATPYDFNGAVASYPMLGTVSADTYRVSGPAAVNVNLVGTNWNYTAALTDGASLDFTFYAWDLAGNQSAGTMQTINWAPSVQLKQGGTFPFTGPVNDGGTSYSAELTCEVQSGSATDGVTSYSVLSGFNAVINQVRAD